MVRRVGIHGRAAVIDGFGAQFVVPGFVIEDRHSVRDGTGSCT
jgi:hypothetical protein